MGRILKEHNGDFMKVEYSSETPKNKPKRSKSKKKLRFTFYIFITIIVLGIVVALSLTVLFNVRTFSVNGAGVYTAEEIIAASGLEEGDNIIRLSADDAETLIEKSLPYVKNAEIKKEFPSKIIIDITPAEEFAVVETEEGVCVIDADYKVLKLDKSNVKLPRIKGLTIGDVKPGEVFEFDDEVKKTFEAIVSATKSRGLNVTYYDLSDNLDLKFAIDDRIFVKLGSVAHINEKMNTSVESIKRESPDAQFVLSLLYWDIYNGPVTTYEDIGKLIR